MPETTTGVVEPESYSGKDVCVEEMYDVVRFESADSELELDIRWDLVRRLIAWKFEVLHA